MKRILWTFLAIAGFASTASACTACFGKTDEAMAQGMNAGIFALLAFVGMFWIMFASFFVFLVNKRRQTGELLPGQQDDPQHN